MFDELIQNAKTIAIGGHVRPDGDCVGAVMAMYLYLSENYKEKKVDAYLESIPESFHFLTKTDQIKHEVEKDLDYDLFISLDCGDIERLGFSIPIFKSAKNTCCIDHHVSNQSFAKENYIVPSASSTCELVFQLLNHDHISKAIAEALYLGIVHDTGVFQYSNVSPSTLQAAAFLLQQNIDAPSIISNTFYKKSFAQNKVLGKCLLESNIYKEGKVISSFLTKKEMDTYQVGAKDLDGIVNQLQNTQGVELAIFMYELFEGHYKVSLRSLDCIDVSEIAMNYGGGGHKKAAGFDVSGNPQDIISDVIGKIKW